MSEAVWRLTIRSEERSVDVLSGALYRAGYEGLEIVPGTDPAAGVSVRAYAVTRHGLEEIARATSEVPGCTLATIEEIRLEDWAEEWRKHFKPIHVGHRLVVVPPWQSTRRFTDRISVVIEPGHAFGTGTHASTRLALEAMEEVQPGVPAGGGVVDLGCGSGILAIAAVKLGMGPVTAIDIDPEALDAARENARRNGVHNYIAFVEGDHHGIPGKTSLLVANLSAPIHRGIAAQAAPRIAPGGRVLLSGILLDEVDGVERAWPAAWASRRATQEEWALLALTVPASG